MNRPTVLVLSNVDSSWPPDEAEHIAGEVAALVDAIRQDGGPVVPIEIRRDILGPLRDHDPRQAIVFNWCEGLDGEPTAYDKAATLLEASGFAYTGSDAWTLAHTQNKAGFKAILDQLDVPTPTWRIFVDARQASEWTTYPAIVKPVDEHASVGITLDSVVEDVVGLRRQIDSVMDEFGAGALVEEYIDGREIYASIWGNGELEVLPLHDIDFSAMADPRERIVDSEAKWDQDTERYRLSPERCPIEIDAPTEARVQRAAVAAFRGLRIRDYGRIDLRVRDGVPYVIDVNPNCSLTRDEGGFMLAATVAGYEYGEALWRIVELAAARMPR